MNVDKSPGLGAYAALPLLTVVLFSLAALFFVFVMGDPSPVPVFVIFALIWSVSMTLFAVLSGRGKSIARGAAMFLVGSFILVLAGWLGRNNFQIEGFFFQIFSGTLSGVIVHFAVGKILGPVLTGRAWCGWGCWTGMVLDCLPYKGGAVWRGTALSRLRAVHFALALLLTGVLYYGFSYTTVQADPEAMKTGMGTVSGFLWFAAGNALYYAAGIALAIAFKDNRAFCKYLCPVTVFLRTGARVALLRIKGDSKQCTSCGTCSSSCPMGIDIPAYVAENRRVASTECILCMKCVAACPTACLKTSVGFDVASVEHLRRPVS